MLGAIVLAMAGIFIAFAYSTANIKSVSGYAITANFLKVGGLERGSDVRISGIPVGTVTGEDLDPQSFLARVTMTVDDNVKLPADTEASIVSDGLLGGKYVNLIPGRATDRIPPGGKIAKTHDFQSLEDMVGQIIFLATQDSNTRSAAPAAAPAPAAPASSSPAAPLPDAPE
jgi:phospholipid/cholesterol/gamma-HCH transport system substrate-binding protein